MTATDHAFIRAYRQDGTARGAAAVDIAAEVLRTEADREPPRTHLDELPEPSGTHDRTESADILAFPSLQVESAAAEEASAVADDQRFRPLLEVDSFAWPERCVSLSLAAGIQLDRLADGLAKRIAQGQKVVALGGCRRGQGCTTLLLCAARRLAQRGLKVVMVDADFDNPMLARRLGLLAESGWEEVLAGRLPLAEVLIESIEDRLAVLPLLAGLSSKCDPPDPARSLDVLREHYDLVLVDLGALGGGTCTSGGADPEDWQCIDAVVLVHDVRSTPRAELVQAARRLRAAGIAEVAVAENFV